MALKERDKKAVRDFYKQRPSKYNRNSIINTDGRTLYRGNKPIGKWERGKVRILTKMDGKDTESTLRYMRKEIPKLNFKYPDSPWNMTPSRRKYKKKKTTKRRKK